MTSPDSSPPESVTLDPERQQQARQYARLTRRLMLVDMVLGAAYIIMWLATGLHLRTGEWVASVAPGPWLATALYALVFGLPYMAIDLPLSTYTGFVLPHRYGQSTQTLRSWLVDTIKGAALSGVFGLILLEIMYALLRAAPALWWLYTAGVILLFSVILSTLSPVLIAPLFYKFTPLDDDDLTARLTHLAEQAGTAVRGVYRFDMSTRTRSANAAVMGLGATRRIVLGDTLLAEFTPDEIETVLAHELGHHVHRDMPAGIAINTILTLASLFAAHLGLNVMTGWFGLSSTADPAGLPVFLAVTGVVGLLVMPLGNAYSRWREREADRYALQATRKPDAFASAMTRLANQNLADADPESWVVWLLNSPPPIRDRVGMANAYHATYPS